MKAIVYRDYGSPEVLRYADTDKPRPADGEVLVKVCSAGVNPYDWHFMRGLPYPLRMRTGLRAPKDSRLGADVAGLVLEVGTNVREFKVGDSVFGMSRGAFAEYVCAEAGKLALKPENVSFDQAAATPIAGLTALQGLRRGGLSDQKAHPRPKVLINGAAGGVGTFAVQIAATFGAEVAAVCSTRNVEMVRSLGAERVIDYTREDFTTRSDRYDIVLDCIANHSLQKFAKVLSSAGRYVLVGAADGGGRWMMGMLSRLAKSAIMSRKGKQQFTMIGAKPVREDLAALGELMSTGEVRPLIDRYYPLSETAEALRHIETGHARGKVVIRVQ